MRPGERTSVNVDATPRCRTVAVRGARRLWLEFVSLLALALTVTAAQAAEARKTIVFFGDSLTAGLGLDNPDAEAYPAVIQKKIDEAGLPWRVVNAGLSGETSAAGVRRVDWVLRQPANIFFLVLGANDGLRGIDPKETEQNLIQIIRRVRTKYPQAGIVLAGMEMPPTMGAEYTTKFRAIFPKVAELEHVTLTPFILEGIGGRSDLNQSDGIHPTAAGHKLLAENVWKVLRPLL